MTPARRISSEEAASLVKSGMWLDYAVGLSQPDVFDRALALRKDELDNVKIRSCISMRPRAVLESDPESKHFFFCSWHFTGYDRQKHDPGCCHYMPVNLGEVPDYYRRFLDPMDMLVLKTRPIDENGYFNFGPTNMWHRAAIERARMVVVEVNENLPYAFGTENGVHVSEVDYVIEGDRELTPELLNPPPTDVDRAVGRRIASAESIAFNRGVCRSRIDRGRSPV